MRTYSLNPRSLVVALILALAAVSPAQEGDSGRLAAAMLGDTPMVSDLQSLTDEIGGRPTGSDANLKSVEWALSRFREAGIDARKEAFTMPAGWLEETASVEIKGDVSFSPRVVSMPFSIATPPSGITAPLIDGGFGTEDDFKRLGVNARGKFVIIETHELLDIDGLFREYAEAVEIEHRAFAAGVAGLVYTSSRSKDSLYRHNASLGSDNKHPLLIMERDEALRTLRLLRAGKHLSLTAHIKLRTGPAYESYNVVGEIRGSERPDEFVLIGAHLDSWDLGTGALDNGCNVVMVIDIARQLKRLNIKPRRTIRFALFNGEEQGLYGSWGYTKTHAAEMDNHVMASSYDIGSGRITGFFTNGRAEILPAVDRALMSLNGLGPFQNLNLPIVGTDNYDFMIQGVANLVANQESANYGPNYHARSDTFDKVDLKQLRLNAAIAGVVTYSFAQMDVNWTRQGRAQIDELIKSTDLGQQMKSFGLWNSWVDGTRSWKK
jgi:carboxypeptidase Q